MIVLRDIEQGSPEWFAARLGIPTSSEFDKILTPAKLDRSTQATGYRYRLLAEFITGKPHKGYTNDTIERGKVVESEARTYFECLTDKTLSQVGFIYGDESRLFGCSPDGVEESNGEIVGGCEIKCPEQQTQVAYLLNGGLPREYVLQVQGNMLVTGLRQWDFLSYHPDMRPLLITVKRDEKIICALRNALEDFIATMLREREQLTNGYGLKAALEASLEVLHECTAVTG